ncbi:hypothetical protein EVAR_25100_1 [Eumeta japonica]|uniref:Integrase zinc-binding domain-containing protein n=1 Tax=Eumeta variegata TaxID=151549 RepID=A0A4C1ZIE5_EUMVA|nr:hypothetical protein EVAR_25100_1 [Eumeta japonica]
MKTIARNYVYWPGLDVEIETLCRACEPRRQQPDAPPHAPLTPPVAFPGASVAAAAHGFRGVSGQTLPRRRRRTHEMDRGNGAAENAVNTIKKCIKKAIAEGEDPEQALSRMLFHCSNCEYATTGVSPAMAMFERRLRGRLDALRPNTALRVFAAQSKQPAHAAGMPRAACSGDTVSRGCSIAQPKWVEGCVRETVGLASYNAELPSRVVRRPRRSTSATRDLRTKDVNETGDAVASSGVQSEREAARESCEVHSILPAPAREALVEAEASKEATEKRTPGSPNSSVVVHSMGNECHLVLKDKTTISIRSQYDLISSTKMRSGSRTYSWFSPSSAGSADERDKMSRLSILNLIHLAVEIINMFDSSADLRAKFTVARKFAYFLSCLLTKPGGLVKHLNTSDVSYLHHVGLVASHLPEHQTLVEILEEKYRLFGNNVRDVTEPSGNTGIWVILDWRAGVSARKIEIL